MHARNDKRTYNLVGKPDGKSSVGRLGAGRRIILKVMTRLGRDAQYSCGQDRNK
jgi:hypothetical protein